MRNSIDQNINNAQSSGDDFAWQYQYSRGSEIVFHITENNDVRALLQLMLQNKAAPHGHADYKITEIGGGDGNFTKKVLTGLIENNIIPVKTKVSFDCCEPNTKKSLLYPANMKKTMIRVGDIHIYNTTFENPHLLIKKSDLIFCFQSLYFSAPYWRDAPIYSRWNPLPKLFYGLKQGAFLIVSLQSNDAALCAKKSKNPHPLNEEVEKLLYPMARQYTKDGSIWEDGRWTHPELSRSNHKKDKYTNAEEFHKQILLYAIYLKQKTDIELTIEVGSAISSIIFEHVNFRKNAETGKYDQDNKVTKHLFKFYSRGRYNNFTPEHQEAFLEFLKQRCQTKDGKFCINHLHKLFKIRLSREITQRDLDQILAMNDNYIPDFLKCDIRRYQECEHHKPRLKKLMSKL